MAAFLKAGAPSFQHFDHLNSMKAFEQNPPAQNLKVVPEKIKNPIAILTGFLGYIDFPQTKC